VQSPPPFSQRDPLTPYNRALKLSDYEELVSETMTLADFRSRCHGLFYRNDHEHRSWEYAQVLCQLSELRIEPPARILDTGSGCSYFPLLLKTLGYDIVVNDSMAYGDTIACLRAQCFHFGFEIPLIVAPIEKLGIESDQWDVVLCVSVIEHLPTTEFANGLRELYRVAKPGGYLFITSDYFKDEPHALSSPSLAIQHNRFYPHTAEQMINDHIDVEWVGGVDLTYHEPGLVNGHSFVNLCLRKPSR